MLQPPPTLDFVPKFCVVERVSHTVIYDPNVTQQMPSSSRCPPNCPYAYGTSRYTAANDNYGPSTRRIAPYSAASSYEPHSDYLSLYYDHRSVEWC